MRWIDNKFLLVNIEIPFPGGTKNETKSKAAFKKWNLTKNLDDRISYNKLNLLAVNTFTNKKRLLQTVSQIYLFPNPSFWRLGQTQNF